MFDTGPMSAAPAPYLSRDDLAGRLPAGSWQRVVYDEFAATISSPVRPFPCVFGVKGFETDQLRRAIHNRRTCEHPAHGSEADSHDH